MDSAPIATEGTFVNNNASSPPVDIRFYAELGDFLAPAQRARTRSEPLERRTSVKDYIEACGVPHPEVDLIVVNGLPVGFEYLVQPGDRISVYPPFRSIDISSLKRLRKSPLPACAFIVDSNLGRLAKYLRLLGFNTVYRNDYADAELAETAAREARVVLTRDRALLYHKVITHGLFIRATQPREQTVEVVSRLRLKALAKPFSRCTRCNGRLRPVEKSAIEARLEPRTRQFYSRFARCPECDAIYWEGSHHRRAQRLVDALLGGDFRSPENRPPASAMSDHDP